MLDPVASGTKVFDSQSSDSFGERQRLLDLDASLKAGSDVFIPFPNDRGHQGGPAGNFPGRRMMTDDEVMKAAVGRFKHSGKGPPPMNVGDSPNRGLVHQKFPCARCVVQQVCPYYDPGGTCVYEVERYKHYILDMQRKGKNATDLLFDFTAKSMAMMDMMRMVAQANPTNANLQLPVVKMTEIIANNLDKLQKHSLSTKVSDSMIQNDFDRVLSRVQNDIAVKRREDVKSQAVDAVFVEAPSTEPSSSDSVVSNE